MTTAEKPQYDSIAQSYASYESLPLAKLEHELVTKAIGDCTGLTVLDLGGGNGQYARKAIELGAELVDVVDISPAMLEVGIEIEQKLGREGKIRWFEADAAKAMHNLPLMPDGYDIVMCNWLFDHAESDKVSTLEHTTRSEGYATGTNMSAGPGDNVAKHVRATEAWRQARQYTSYRAPRRRLCSVRQVWDQYNGSDANPWRDAVSSLLPHRSAIPLRSTSVGQARRFFGRHQSSQWSGGFGVFEGRRDSDSEGGRSFLG